jgi:hypothetical protein
MAASSSLLILLLVVLIPVGLIVVGVILINRARRGRFPYPACGACNYDLSATIGAVDRCPECGAEFKMVGIIAPSSSNRREMKWAGIALLSIGILVTISCGGLLVLPAIGSARSAASRAAAIRAAQTAQPPAASQPVQSAPPASAPTSP